MCHKRYVLFRAHVEEDPAPANTWKIIHLDYDPMTRLRTISFVVTLFAGAFASCATEKEFDIVVRNGLVYDGLGNSAVETDIGIRADTIAAMGDLSGATAPSEIDATGKTVVPGFIDIHSHATSVTIELSGIVLRPMAENYIRQGVTTAVGGQDGSSPIDIGAFLAALDTTNMTVNVGLFVGHGSIRSHVMGNSNRAPTQDELAQMTELVGLAMDAGAFGLSSGLEYTPGGYADLSELVAMARPAANAGGLYISHIRDEGARLLESIAEVIEVAEKAGVAAQVTHHKVIGKGRWGDSTKSLALIDEAGKRGLDVSSDVYPYTASSTGLTILFPAWSLLGGNKTLLDRLSDVRQRDRIRADIIRHINEERGADPRTIVAASCPDFPEVNGLSLAGILEERGIVVTVEGAAEVAMELVEKGGCLGVFHSMSEDDVRRIMLHPNTMISSDGGIPNPGTGVPHPRNYGAFARVLARYVREWGILSMEEAIYKMSGLPAERLGLFNRGRLQVGAIADIAVLDATAMEDHAEFGDPHHYATGVSDVLVAGRIVLRDGVFTGERPGRALRH